MKTGSKGSARQTRICMLAPSHPAWDPRVVQREARSLARLGFHVGVVAMHDHGKPFAEGLELLPLPREPLTRWKRIKIMWRVYRLGLRFHADVYHAHEVESLAVGLLLKWRTGAKLIFDAHECFHFTAARFSTGWRARVIRRLTTCLLRFMARRAAHVIVVSFTNEEFYRDHCGCRNVTIIHNSPPPAVFPCTNKPPDAVLTITHDGVLSMDRGMNVILEALAIIRPQISARLLVVGTVQESARGAFSQQVRERGLEDAVQLTGWIPYDQVGARLNEGAIGLVAMQPTPNNYGSLSNKLFNYMSTGQAVIGPIGSNTAEIIRRANCGIAVDMTSPQALAEGLLGLLSDPAHCRELGMNGRRAVEEEYGWHHMERHLVEIYTSLGCPPPQNDVAAVEH